MNKVTQRYEACAKVLKEFCDEVGLDVEDIKHNYESGWWNKHLNDMRFLSNALRREGFSYRAIGWAMSKDHKTIINHVRKAQCTSQ